MNEINNEDFGEVRAVMIDGEPWFQRRSDCAGI